MYYKPGSDLEIDYISGFVYDRRKYLEIALFFRSMRLQSFVISSVLHRLTHHFLL